MSSSAAAGPAALAADGIASTATEYRVGLVTANVWLFFLAFPLLSILSSEDLDTASKVVGTVLIAVFGVVHFAGYHDLSRRCHRPIRSIIWFGALAATGLTLGVVVGWAALGVTPFLVSFAVFNFSWTTGLAVVALLAGAAIIGPLLGGRIEDLWYFSLIIIGVAAGASFNRLSEERMSERSEFETRIAVSDELSRVARDVHDVLGHSLTAVILKAQLLDRLLAQLDPTEHDRRQVVDTVDRARCELAELMQVSRQALDEVRTTVVGLRAADLADELAAARSVLADAGVSLAVVGDAADVAADRRSLVAAVVRESVTNVVRHASAKRCEIELGARSDRRLVQIRDDGVGLGDYRPGSGLIGLRERVEAEAAELRVGSARLGGTSIEVVAADEGSVFAAASGVAQTPPASSARAETEVGRGRP